MSDAPQTGAAVDGCAVVIAIAELPFTGVQAHAHIHGSLLRPGFGVQGSLDSRCSADPIYSALEDHETAIALTARPNDIAIVLLGQALDDLIVTL